ncbi:unnamed protein product [Chrysodeixis includens]|uniref:Multiple inositol polyphosphate phosphatase 1 n=1 Tax=Chrysodeixis includens TaxID=689277 RepID=A0A9N8PYJ5_CHRIL|nr:unnamed protein product [Chrysodeixis includens]
MDRTDTHFARAYSCERSVVVPSPTAQAQSSQYLCHCARGPPRFPRILTTDNTFYPESLRAKMTWLYLLLAVAVTSAQEICLSVQEDPYLLFGTKTAYIFANKDIPTTKAHEVPGCQPIAFWLLNRHGSHNPEADEIAELEKLSDLKNNILTNYKNGNFRTTNQRICSSDLSLLENWSWNSRINQTYAGDLTVDGYMTTQQLAQTWKHKFPGLLTANQHNYLFKFVNDKRSSNTFKAFTEGLFGDQAEGLDIPRENDEKFLEPYKFCPAWAKEVGDNTDTLSQRAIFESKMEYKEMISNISLRLGFNYDIQKEIVQRMYQICRYNKAWDVVKISPWCAAFTREDLKRLEYAEDLEMYYKYGYGSPRNQDLGCTLVKDMMTFFEKHAASDEPQQPRVKIQFSEASLLLLTLTALGAHRDSAPLTGDNYHSAPVQARQWSTSTMSPFNANFAGVLYNGLLELEIGKFSFSPEEFSEASLLLLTLTALGAHRDSAPLTGDNYHSAPVQARQWSTSTMSPFNANFAGVLYNGLLELEIGKFSFSPEEFSEASLLLLTLTALGAHRDSAPLTGDNYHSAPVQARQWSTSTMSPFNANFAGVLYKCTQNGNFQVNEQFQVLFLENERPMRLDGCRVGLCDLSLVKNKLGELTKNCNLDFCNGTTRLNINSYTLVFVAISFVVRAVIRI